MRFKRSLLCWMKSTAYWNHADGGSPCAGRPLASFAGGVQTFLPVGHFLPAWRPGLKVREAAQPKFYWFDPGVTRAAAGLLRDPADRQWQGLALETLVYHELRVYNEISRKHRPLSHYRTPAGVEVDFIVETSR